jgi:anti-anti-sigma factor
MAANAYASTPKPRHREVSYIEHVAGVTTVWLRGEQDLVTETAFAQMIERAVRADNGNVVVDVSGVEFMSVGTVGIIIRAQAFLREGSRSLTVRAPSRCVRRLLDLCCFDYVDGSVDTKQLAESRP